MSHVALALGAAMICAAGCVWYLPALEDLRSGDDRPRSVRTAASACLTGWGTGAALAVLLFAAVPWWALGLTAGTGAAAAAAVSVRARSHRRREAADCWTALLGGAPDGRPVRAGRIAWAWALSGLVVVSASAGVLLLVPAP
ncbi:hypothetical protein [Streptomyces luteireticuli]|uniref:DUF3325 domain-containing protein n=1 Tax=Streptomyces luteireticuli TaxID=173858 RepID=A0ABN0YN61_9ACTN